jgi:uncharacterized repeat protein (TIGR01451 family)
MKNIIIAALSICSSMALHAQIGFHVHRIDSMAIGANGVFAGDVDGDGDSELFSAALTEGVFGWYENFNDSTGFSARRTLHAGSFKARNIHGGDLDGDGDLDIILCAQDLNQVSWLENMDGRGGFGNLISITTQAASPYSAKPFDLDGDGDLDILTASYADDKIAWYENLDGAGHFGPQQILTPFANGASDAIAADLDQDGDLDVLSTSLLDNTTAWFENLDGHGTFSDEQILTQFSINPSAVHASDLDGDGDLDVYIAAQAANNIVWWENLDGAATFSTRQYIDISSHNTRPLVLADVDQDGDQDFISGQLNGNSIEWHDHLDGQLNFAGKHITNEIMGVRALMPDDVDNDGDMDVVVASEEDHSIWWIENVNLQSNALYGRVQLNFDDTPCDDSSKTLANIRVNAYSVTDTISTFTLSSGHYQLYPGIGDYVTSLTTYLPPHYVVTPDTYHHSFNDIGLTNYQDFCINPEGLVKDVSISMYPIGDARPGFLASYKLIVKNLGTIALSDKITITFNADMMEFRTTNASLLFTTANTIDLMYDEIQPLAYRAYDIQFKILPPPIVNIGDQLELNANAQPVDDDPTINNNSYTLTQTVIGSFDPNDILVLEGERIRRDQLDDYLHYLIRFQNTGTASAINVRVENTLDQNLDWSTFEPEDISHRSKIHVENGDQVTFDFDYINLPDSNADEASSHGYIMYRIKPKSNLSLGDSILNKASIFFDFNLPIVTNTVVTRIEEISETKNVELVDFSVYPNPATDMINIDASQPIDFYLLYDRMGKLIIKFTGRQLDISELKSGIYFCKAYANNGQIGYTKFVVTR